MAILKNPNIGKFTIVPNKVLKDNSLSLKARGLLVTLLSLPDDWEFSENGLCKIFPKDGQTSIRSGLKELEKSGYLVRKRMRDKHGRIGKVEWTIYDLPHFENPNLGNHSQLNTEELNTKDIEKKEVEEKKTDEAKTAFMVNAGDKRPAPPYDDIKNLYNNICRSLPRCTALSNSRKRAISARLSSGYTAEDFERVFTKAEASTFLRGGNNRNWTATFDWLIKDANFAKVLDGNYDNAAPNPQPPLNPNRIGDLDEFF